jgi:hypothetical protein
VIVGSGPAALKTSTHSERSIDMKRQILTYVAGIAIACVTVSSVSAVGSGLPFLVAETQIAGAKPHVLVANSMDLTYHHQYPNGTNNPAGFNLPDWVWPFFVLHPCPWERQKPAQAHH